MFCTLLVDDSEVSLSKLGWLLKRHFPRLRVAQARSGDDALRLARLLRPDMILSSVHLSGRRGACFIEEVKEWLPGTVVVALASDDLPEYRRAALHSGADAFISKQSPDYLTEVLAEVGGGLAGGAARVG